MWQYAVVGILVAASAIYAFLALAPRPWRLRSLRSIERRLPAGWLRDILVRGRIARLEATDSGCGGCSAAGTHEAKGPP
jgi:hypothetical protein